MTASFEPPECLGFAAPLDRPEYLSVLEFINQLATVYPWQRKILAQWFWNDPWFEWYRAHGRLECDCCGRQYIDHVRDADFPWLRILCSGEAVKT